jgi:hypothetical protein
MGLYEWMKKILLVILLGLGAIFYLFRVDIVREVQRVDASSPEAMRASIQEIEKGLSDEEKVIFARGIMRLSAEGMNLSTMMAMTGEDEIRWRMVAKPVNGKSVRVILAKGRN